jgi:D-alanyl-D-alanine carboxypeptidase
LSRRVASIRREECEVFESARFPARVSRVSRPQWLAPAVWLAFAAALASPPLAAEPLAAAVEREGERLVTAFTADASGPGVAVLVARGDEVLFRGARGMASIELGVPLSADHVFRIGSVTKQFGAAGLLALVDDGKVALDDPLSRFLPDYPDGDAITIAQLLNHTSGIKSYTGIPGYMDQEIRRDLDTAALVAVFRDQPVDFAPGAEWKYNNSGYVLVGAVIEQASGMRWDRWLQQRMFAPLEMRHTRGGEGLDVVAMHVSGYGSDAQGGVQIAAPISMSQPHAAGALLSTVDDLWRWNRALHGGRLLSADSYQRMITPEGAAAENGHAYGYGIQAITLRGRPALEHGGGIHGFLSSLIYLPDGEITVAVLRNSTAPAGANIGMMARQLAAVALGDPYPEARPVELPLAELQALEGVYRVDAEITRTLRVADGVLTSQRSGGSPFRLIPIGDDRFLFEQSLSYLRIERDAQGAPIALRFHQGGEGDGERSLRSDEPVAHRASIELPPAALARLVGQYSSPQLGLKVFLDDAEVLRVQVPGQPALALKAQTPARFHVSEVDASFEFAPAEGPVESVTLLQGPVRIVMQRSGD